MVRHGVPAARSFNTRKTQDVNAAPLIPCGSPFPLEDSMDEQRKYAILFAATILAARKLNEIGSKPCPARKCAISDAISKAELILRRIDERWPEA